MKVLFNLALAMQAEGQLVRYPRNSTLFSAPRPFFFRLDTCLAFKMACHFLNQAEACGLYEQVVAEEKDYHDAW